jgi:hypothetical protein
MLVDRRKAQANYKMEVVSRKGGRLLLRKIIKNGSNFFFLNEVLGLKMRLLFLKLSLEWSMDDNTKDSKKKTTPYASSNYSSLEFGAHVALLQEC